MQIVEADHLSAPAPLQPGHTVCRTTVYAEIEWAQWERPQDVKDIFGASVDFVGDSRIVFDVGGNKFRLVARVVYGPYYRVMIKFIGTHEENDKIDVAKI